MSKIEVRILSQSEYNQWDQLVEQSRQGTIFHSSKWLTTTQKNLRSNYIIIGAFNKSDLIGGCSFFINKAFNFLKTGRTKIPLTPYGGFVLSSPKDKKGNLFEIDGYEAISVIIEKIKTLNLFNVNLINSPGLTDIRPFLWQGWRERVFYTNLVSLDNDIYLNFSRNLKRNILKSQNLGITVRKEYNPDIFWKLTKSTYDRQSLKVPFEKEYLFNLFEMLIQNNLGEMWMARTSNSEPTSAEFFIWDTKCSYRWMGSSDEQSRSTGASSHLLYEILLDFQKRGFHEINMMSGNIQHLAKFTSGFNPRLVPYYGVEMNHFNNFLQILNFNILKL
jgi:hypothetical protein